jgi:hypothetical protein
VERSEAEAIYAQGREPVVEVLLALSARLEAQDAQLTALAERVEELEQQLKRDSRNSSLPPSHDPPWLGKRGRSRETGRKQGGQPGHPGHGRALFSSERLTDVVDHWPERCACGDVFGEEERERLRRGTSWRSCHRWRSRSTSTACSGSAVRTAGVQCGWSCRRASRAAASARSSRPRLPP